MIVNCRRLRNILSFFPYLSVNCICASLPKIVNRIRHEKGEAPRAGLPKIIYTTNSISFSLSACSFSFSFSLYTRLSWYIVFAEAKKVIASIFIFIFIFIFPGSFTNIKRFLIATVDQIMLGREAKNCLAMKLKKKYRYKSRHVFYKNHFLTLYIQIRSYNSLLNDY